MGLRILIMSMLLEFDDISVIEFKKMKWRSYFLEMDNHFYICNFVDKLTY